MIVAGCLLCLPGAWTRAGRLRTACVGPESSSGVTPQRCGDRCTGCPGFWLLRTPSHFLGDGRMMIRLLEQGDWFRPTELLDRWLHTSPWSSRGGHGAGTRRPVYAALSVVAGFIYVLAALKLGAFLATSSS